MLLRRALHPVHTAKCLRSLPSPLPLQLRRRHYSSGTTTDTAAPSPPYNNNNNGNRSIFYDRFVEQSPPSQQPSSSSSHSSSHSPSHSSSSSNEGGWSDLESKETVLRRGRMWDWNERKAEHERMIRVDHAGELGAVRICQGQMAVLRNDPVIREIYEEELTHYNRFQQLVAEHRVRPTVMHPIWNVAGYALGVATALMGRPAAMACHKAVEEVIAEHYNDQIRTFYNTREREALQQQQQGDGLSQGLSQEQYQREQFMSAAQEPSRVNAAGGCPVKLQDDKDEQKLKETFVRFRDEEIHHHDLAVENDAHKAPVYNVLYNTIKAGCHAAIWISSRF